MNLIVFELEDSIYQEMMPVDTSQFVSAIRPHIYKHNAPTGTLTIQVQDQNGRMIKESDVVNISDISSANYFHGYIRFDITIGLMIGKTYRIALVAAGGYTFSESAYIGWCNGYDLGKYNLSYESNSTFEEPLDMEIWSLQEVTKGGNI